MLIVKMLLCASAVMLSHANTTESKPQPKAAVKTEKTATAKSDKKQTPKAEKKTNKKTDPTARAKSPAANKSKEKETVVDGVRLSDVEVNIVSYTNEERTRYGLPPLEVDKELMSTAREQAAWMTWRGSMFHTNRPLAENVAMGQTHSSEAVQSWMNSSGHRANILNPGHRRIGVAAYRGPGGIIYWCQQFRQ
jgi:uncharacterized protein YkwD